ncbi:glycine cleavage system protein GcvH [Micromonospora echinofusca]|uniref:Glycine cleavage system H protein n=1 Tax=Micromonospora echinofusca TaxID=47858 RepID=A0ABS3VL21_MICEH|nr:glycine cleavage system protein GcvH [Micromonospora echinofusca]MBO4205183.1 glycine cleavage system protein GcvH [Micromonospora echinofusca]
MSVPTHLRYTVEHEWLDVQGDVATVGVTAYAADAIGELVYVDLPAVGTTIDRGQACGEVESTKSVSELYAPVDGEVVEVNEAVLAEPALVHTDPFGKGWLFRIRVAGPVQLLDAAAYEALTGGE